MNTTWSLAVQIQFYTVLPLALLMLRPRAAGFRCALHVATPLKSASSNVMPARMGRQNIACPTPY